MSYTLHRKHENCTIFLKKLLREKKEIKIPELRGRMFERFGYAKQTSNSRIEELVESGFARIDGADLLLNQEYVEPAEP